jgi:hypothetical protein
VVAALVSRPGEAVESFLQFLADSWDEWFGTEWAQVQPGLAARARQFADTAPGTARQQRWRQQIRR